jgi:hypothetical protein
VPPFSAGIAIIYVSASCNLQLHRRPVQVFPAGKFNINVNYSRHVMRFWPSDWLIMILRRFVEDFDGKKDPAASPVLLAA